MNQYRMWFSPISAFPWGCLLPPRKSGDTRTDADAERGMTAAMSPAFQRLQKRAAEKRNIGENHIRLRPYSKYALVTYWSIMRSVLKKEPLSAIALRMTRT